MPPAAAANAAEPDVHLDVNAAAYAVTAVVEMMVVVPTQTQPSLRLLFGARILIELGASSFEISLVEEEPMAGCRRLWWRCPRCQRRGRHIYLLEGRCRRCLGLEYSSRHTQRWANAHRIARLRRLLGVNEQPFAAIPPPKRRRGRYWRLAAAIVVEERKLLADMRRFAASVGKGAPR